MSSLVTSVSLQHLPPRGREVFRQRRPVPPLHLPPILMPRAVARTVPSSVAVSGSLRTREILASFRAPGQTPPPGPGSPPELLGEIRRTSPRPAPWPTLRLLVAVPGEARRRPGPVRDGGELQLAGQQPAGPRGVPVEHFLHRPGGDLDRELGGRGRYTADQGLQQPRHDTLLQTERNIIAVSSLLSPHSCRAAVAAGPDGRAGGLGEPGEGGRGSREEAGRRQGSRTELWPPPGPSPHCWPGSPRWLGSAWEPAGSESPPRRG